MAFHGVVMDRAGAVQIDPADLAGVDAGRFQGGEHGLARAGSGGLGRRHVPGVGTGAAAEKCDGAGVGRFAFHQEQNAGLPDIDAAPVGRERQAERVVYRFQRGEAVDGEAAEGVRAAADHGVAKVQFEQAAGRQQRAGAGGAGRRQGIGRPAYSQPVREECGG
ncbi:hypothetical protein FQZ97_608550 [compost metagenome]